MFDNITMMTLFQSKLHDSVFSQKTEKKNREPVMDMTTALRVASSLCSEKEAKGKMSY